MFRYRIRTSMRRPLPGGRSSRRAGESLDFMELRGYAPGDDPRFVDWKAYARSGRLYTRVWQGEERARFTFWLDGSASMNVFGKLAYARAVLRVLLAAAFPDQAYALGPDAIRRLHGPAALEAVAPDPVGPLAALPRLLRARGQPVLISDGLDEGDWTGFFKSLARKRPIFIQILAPQELDPPLSPAEWRDVESGERRRAGPAEAEAYRAALRRRVSVLRESASAHGGYAHLRVGEEIVPALRRQRVLEWR